MLCKDPYTKLLNDFGYAPLAYPETKSQLGHILIKFGREWKREGDLSDVTTCPVALQVLKNSDSGKHPNLSMQKTDKFSSIIGFKILSPFFDGDFGMILKNVRKISFVFHEVKYKKVDYIKLASALIECRVKDSLQKLGIKSFYCIFDELRTKKLHIFFYDENDEKLDIDIEKIKQIAKPKIALEFSQKDGLEMKYQGKEPITIAVRAFKVDIQDNGMLKPSREIFEKPVKGVMAPSKSKEFIDAIGYYTLLEL